MSWSVRNESDLQVKLKKPSMDPNCEIERKIRNFDNFEKRECSTGLIVNK
jgi:hypothetical protein